MNLALARRSLERLEGIQANRETAAAHAARTYPDRLSILDWTRQYLPHYVPAPPSPFHTWLTSELDRMTEERGTQLLTIAPRGSAKSTWISAAYPLYCLCHGLEPYIILSAESSDQAEKYVMGIRSELEDNERIAADYPEVFGPGPKWTEGALTLRSGARIEGVGAGKRMRGRRQRNMRPSLLIIDDPEDNDSMYSERTRQRRWEWFQGAVKFAGGPGTNVVLVGTMIHEECVVGRVRTAAGWRGRRVFASIVKWPERMDLWDQWEPIYHEDDEAGREFYEAHRADMDAGAEVLWPERVGLYDLMCERAEDRPSFERERQNEALPPEGTRFLAEWFTGDLSWTDPPGDSLRFCAVDPATGKNKQAGDYSAIVWGWWRPGDTAIYVDAILTREPPAVVVEHVVALHKQHDFQMVAFESIAFQEVIRGDLERKLTAAGTSVPVIPATQSQNKFLRIDRLGPLLQRRNFRFRTRSAGSDLLVKQLRRYSCPPMDKLDGPDALEMLVRLIGLYARVRNDPRQSTASFTLR